MANIFKPESSTIYQYDPDRYLICNCADKVEMTGIDGYLTVTDGKVLIPLTVTSVVGSYKAWCHVTDGNTIMECVFTVRLGKRTDIPHTEDDIRNYDNLADRIDANDAELEDHEERITALEAGGGGGTDAVTSVNGKTGNVVLTAEDVGAATTDDIATYVTEHKDELKGDKGDTGPQGEQGIQGETGPEGPQGPQGEKGDDYTLTDADKQEIAGMVEVTALTGKLDKPSTDGTSGQVLGLDDDLVPVWMDVGGSSEKEWTLLNTYDLKTQAEAGIYHYMQDMSSYSDVVFMINSCIISSAVSAGCGIEASKNYGRLGISMSFSNHVYGSNAMVWGYNILSRYGFMSTYALGGGVVGNGSNVAMSIGATGTTRKYLYFDFPETTVFTSGTISIYAR